MIKFDDTKIRLYETFIRDTINSIVQRIDSEKLEKEDKLFLTKIKERLCLDSDNGWRFLTSSLDTIGDSQFAITTFLNHKIENGNQFNTGENYLRLYGVLSAVYIQQQAILKLSDLFKTGHQEKLKNDFDNLEITFLRHCISAHPINYSNNKSKVSFKIDRSSLNDNGLLNTIDESNNFKTYHVFELLKEYISQAENCLEVISQKLISNCYKTAKRNFEELNIKLEKIKNSR